ncbi:YhdH/YhfP family quinone oxidoreductase [Candidatus Riflebacteria bacterium]
MSKTEYKALVVSESNTGNFERQIEILRISELPENEVLIKVHYSSLNYKDALSASGHKGITRKFPHTPGIDAAGEVIESSDSGFSIGENVLVTGFDLGMNTAGGLGQYIRVPANWVVKKPASLSLRECMILGTAGFTAAQGLSYLQENNVYPENGEILVTGATGGVGSLAVAILARAGYPVVAATRSVQMQDLLLQLGAHEIINTREMDDSSLRPMLPGRWAGAIDTVGGNILSTIIRSTKRRATVTFCGIIASTELKTSVFPFILRGIRLIGIDSAECPIAIKRELWQKLAGEWKIKHFDAIVEEIPLKDVSDKIDLMLQGRTTGRIIINHGLD